MKLEYHSFQASGKPASVYNRTTDQFRLDLAKYPNARIFLDDGRLSQYELALPILNELGRKAHFGIITGRVGEPMYMDWEQIKDLHDQGHFIETHTVRHRKLTELMEGQIEREITQSIADIELHTGQRPKYLIPPHNAVNGAIRRIAQRHNLRLPGDRLKMYSFDSPDYWDNIYSDTDKGAEAGTAENLRKRLDQAETWLKGFKWQSLADIGAGYAVLCAELKEMYPDRQITAVDASNAAKTASKYKPYITADAYHPPKADAITCMQTIEYLDDPKRFITAAQKAAKHIFISAAPNHPTAAQKFTPESFAELLGPDFTVWDDGKFLYGATK